jgi:signal transduction histidine kinase
MRELVSLINSQLRFKIIVPFVVLTLLVAIAGSWVAFRLIADDYQERFDNQLAQVTRAANESLVDQEQANLTFLREVATAQENPSEDAPAVATAVEQRDIDGLFAALDPYFRVGLSRSGVQLDRLIVVDTNGRSLADLSRTTNFVDPPYVRNASIDFSNVYLVNNVLNAQPDQIGDKFAGIVKFAGAGRADDAEGAEGAEGADDDGTYYFATAAPIRVTDEVPTDDADDSDNRRTVGAVIVGVKLDNLVSTIQDRGTASVITIFDPQGNALASSAVPADGLASLHLNAPVIERLQNPALLEDGQGIFQILDINGYEYQFALTPLQIRNQIFGVFGAALTLEYVVGPLDAARNPVIGLTVLFVLLMFGTGIWIARLITGPLEELVITARAVTSGNLSRRSRVNVSDEIGVLSSSFNSMTEHLLSLYLTVQQESSRRAAIVESIVDGIVVCDEEGRVQLINRATRNFLGLSETDPLPNQLSDLPLAPLVEGAPGFDTRRSSELYNLGTYIVRVSVAPVLTRDGHRLGYVCVLQDMTAEVELDRAKNNFIGTISHELRTPLTVMRGTTDLLLRGLVGPLEEEQRTMIDSMRQHTTNMTSLINNVIWIAGLDSGSLNTDLQPQEIARAVDEVAWNVRSAIKAKNLTLTIDIPEDMPLVLADIEELRMILTQLLDNARRYTSEGGITLSVMAEPNHALIRVQDTGRGIPFDLQDQVFNRFVRGDGTSEGINSAERGIGLGLAIVKALVIRQGGDVWLESEPDHGSTFSFTLQYANATPEPEQDDRPVTTTAAAA